MELLVYIGNIAAAGISLSSFVIAADMMTKKRKGSIYLEAVLMSLTASMFIFAVSNALR